MIEGEKREGNVAGRIHTRLAVRLSWGCHTNEGANGMPAFFPFEGASRQYYNFAYADLSGAAGLPASPGVIIFARASTSGPAPVYIGVADRIYGFITSNMLWGNAKSKYAADCLYYHIQGDPQRRLAEAEDLVAHYQPPMNGMASPYRYSHPSPVLHGTAKFAPLSVFGFVVQASRQ